MARILTRTIGGAAASIIVGGIAAVAVTGVASAHTPEVSASCTQLHVALANYPANSTVDVVLDDTDHGTTTFGPSAFDTTFPLDTTRKHTWSVSVTSGDGDHAFDKTFAGESTDACLTVAPPVPTPTGTPTPTPSTPAPTTPATPTAPPTGTPSTPAVPTTPATPTPTDTPTPNAPATPAVVTNTPAPSAPATPTVDVTPNGTVLPGTTPTGTSTTAAGAPGTGPGSNGTGELAFTGSPVGLGVGVGALVAMLLGGALAAFAAVRRRRA
ncbi:hypothetical protein DEJ16_03025 [Curtobacterium sp. MCJR17_055]|uniref:hypothetical protein n=1 Tax=unclassified Curtobacterium TaxID=257496 RepID=UPI000D9ECB7F|nr:MULTISPECIES: hypothetical protein [unclassified Curtobacterium]PYY33872.1 hypothetical protein DEI87_11535 [Curtobacterium sp. MCBD17_029]PYY58657.1 hypothetical protein DEJ16_03025 [Curtobacterium sp. MCJR17_055]PYY59801.1 hypothetical protein DEJ26_07880 [Curtobacterium sp. MCPF17_015]